MKFWSAVFGEQWIRDWDRWTKERMDIRITICPPNYVCGGITITTTTLLTCQYFKQPFNVCIFCIPNSTFSIKNFAYRARFFLNQFKVKSNRAGNFRGANRDENLKINFMWPQGYNFGRPFLGHHYYIHSLSYLCLGVEKKIFKE